MGHGEWGNGQWAVGHGIGLNGGVYPIQDLYTIKVQ